MAPASPARGRRPLVITPKSCRRLGNRVRWEQGRAARAWPPCVVGAGRRDPKAPSGRGATMYFKQFLHDDLGCSSYFVASRQSREAVVVDPTYDIQPYLHLAEERGYQIRLVIDTHLHADHLSG